MMHEVWRAKFADYDLVVKFDPDRSMCEWLPFRAKVGNDPTQTTFEHQEQIGCGFNSRREAIYSAIDCEVERLYGERDQLQNQLRAIRENLRRLGRLRRQAEKE